MAFAKCQPDHTRKSEQTSLKEKPYYRHDSVNDVEMTRIYQKN